MHSLIKYQPIFRAVVRSTSSPATLPMKNPLLDTLRENLRQYKRNGPIYKTISSLLNQNISLDLELSEFISISDSLQEKTSPLIYEYVMKQWELKYDLDFKFLLKYAHCLCNSNLSATRIFDQLKQKMINSNTSFTHHLNAILLMKRLNDPHALDFFKLYQSRNQLSSEKIDHAINHSLNSRVISKSSYDKLILRSDQMSCSQAYKIFSATRSKNIYLNVTSYESLLDKFIPSEKYVNEVIDYIEKSSDSNLIQLSLKIRFITNKVDSDFLNLNSARYPKGFADEIIKGKLKYGYISCIDKILATLWSINTSLKPSSNILELIVQTYLANGMTESAISLLFELGYSGFSVNQSTIALLFDTYVKSGNINNASVVLDVMIKAGIDISIEKLLEKSTGKNGIKVKMN